VPTRSLVNIEVGKEKLKVWLGFLNLDCRMPTQEVIERLLYGSPECSAEDADVIAVAFTDLLITQDSVDSMRSILENSLKDHKQYHVNEQDCATCLKHIPCQLVKTSEMGDRYVSLSVAVHKRNVCDYDDNSTIDFCDCFPVPVYLTCKSPKANEVAPGYKSVLAQDVVITRDGETIDLLLFSASLEFEDWAKLAQLNAVQRLIESRRHIRRPFAAVMWGDFNSRLVAFEGLAPHVKKEGTKWMLGDEGVKFLLEMIATPDRRKELINYDALAYHGKDVAGNTVGSSKSSQLFRSLFTAHLDMVFEGKIQAPLPSYKRTPLDYLVSKAVGCQLHMPDLVLTEHLGSPGTSTLFTNDVKQSYFGWKENNKKAPQLVIKAEKSGNGQKNVYLQLGWLDGVGIFKKNTVNATLSGWEIDEHLQAYDHLPMRALVHAFV